MPLSYSSKPFFTKPTFKYYNDIVQDGLQYHCNLSNSTCRNNSDPNGTTILDLSPNGYVCDLLVGTVGTQISDNYLSDTIARSQSSFTIAENNKVTVEIVARLPAATHWSGSCLSTGDIALFATNTNSISSRFKVVCAGTELETGLILLNYVYYIAATYDGDTGLLSLYYYNLGTTGFNVPQSRVKYTTTISGSPILDTTPEQFLWAGRTDFDTRSVRLYNRVLSDSEIFYNAKRSFFYF